MKTVIHSVLHALVLLGVLAADVALADRDVHPGHWTKRSADLCD